jgi:hypothetical protein
VCCVSCRAQAAGKQRQIVEIINPINEKANNFLATGGLLLSPQVSASSASISDQHLVLAQSGVLCVLIYVPPSQRPAAVGLAAS